MGLCKLGERGGHSIYTLGKASESWDRWTGASADQQGKWRALIIAAADAVRLASTCMLAHA